ncbi:tautomerase family protein [Arenibaculum sp.]|jgi:4-oxalocrotonate tautomerase|uniref:tautomerase family protein n=1 Tax=Arenibaculum sp. TaxID=2865862 RepID=UPI002E0D5783|nr:tautomerase family protein [Arenibaculum sp.]
MPIIEVTTWTGITDDKARELMESLTRTTVDVLKCPLDKVTVYVSEVPKARWSEAGTIGSDPDWATKSRRQGY